MSSGSEVERSRASTKVCKSLPLDCSIFHQGSGDLLSANSTNPALNLQAMAGPLPVETPEAAAAWSRTNGRK